jgi:CHAT domain-containing protein
VTERNRRNVGESTTQWRARITAARRELLPLAARLSEQLLSPVARDLKSRRLLIVSSGALQYFPFAALPLPRGAVGAGMPLVSRHEVAVLPSVSTVAALRELRSGRTAPSLTVAVIADPVFASSDSRVDRAGRLVIESAATPDSAGWRVVTRGLESPGTLPRLLNTRKEALAIQSLVPATRRAVSLDFAANTTTALHPSLAQYRIVHFATHAFVNSESPEFSGIALSMVDERGVSRDGYVRLSQIYNMRLRADLVVLSACQTALGKDVKGEGLIGLTRAFLFAGATSVVASLWKVDDEATAELMKRFYSGMLGPTPLRPVAALRAAQVSLARETRWRDPYYWAGFVLQGDWK